MKYYFPLHLDGGNRGCEAIAKASAILLDIPKDNIIGYCRNTTLDSRLGLEQNLTLIPRKVNSIIIDKTLGIINRLLHTRKSMELRMMYPYRTFLNLIDKDDIMISTGGDMMCYGDNEVIYTNNALNKKGIKTILWGCSMGPENITLEKKKTLSKFSLIYTRESLSYNFFNSLGLKNVCLFPDPAFILPIEECNLPECLYCNNVIGINISNYVAGGMTLDSKFGSEIKTTISYILRHTNLHILLVPHVTWKFRDENQDDREMAEIIKREFASTDRITTLNIDKKNYCQIRYAISKCKFFVGARTHAVISAYSMCVPTIALGYSIKSKGIAKDLGLSERLIVDSKNIKEGQLVNSLKYLIDNETYIRSHMETIMPEYKQRPYGIRDILKNL